MKIKLVATDMDGTLLDSQKRKPADFIPWVIEHPEIKTVIASGRQYFTLRDDFAEIADKLLFIAENGGLVFERDEILYSNPMQYEDIVSLLKRVESMPDVTPIVCGAASAYMQNALPHIEAEGHTYYHHLSFVEDLYAVAQKDIIVKIALFVDNFKAEAVYNALGDLGERISSVLSGASWIDVANTSVSKGSAVGAIQDKYNRPVRKLRKIVENSTQKW